MTEHTRYSRLAKITQSINSNLDLKSVLQHVVTAISEEIVGCDSVGIYLPQGDGTFRGFVGKPEYFAGLTIDQIIVDPAVDQLACEILEKIHSIYIPDTSLDPRPDPRKVELFQIKSMLGVPISYENELYGLVFLFDSGNPMSLAQSEIEAVESYVTMAAVAIRNAKLLTRQQSLLEEKQILLDATRELSLCSNARDVLATSFRFVGQALSNSNISVHLADPVSKKFYPLQVNLEHRWTEQEWERTHNEVNLNYEEEPLFQEVIQNKKAVLVPDVRLDHRPTPELCRKFGVSGIFMLPLVVTGDLLGIMVLVDVEEVRVYTEAEILLAQSLADSTATVLANVIRMEQLELMIKTRTAELHEKNAMLEQIVEQLKSVDQMKNDFLASVSHELRTPMTAVKGSVELLKSGILGPLKPEQMELVEMAEQGIMRLLHKVNEILDYSKIQNGTFPIQKVKTDYADLIGRTIEIVTPLFTKKAQQLNAKIKQLPQMSMDPDRIEQVLLNLLTNASKFTPESGTVSIYAEMTDEGILTTVEDTGIGIPADCLEKIFDRFYQVKQGHMHRSSGNGLGLSIAKQIIDLHGGEIWAESTAGEGSRFYFLLPE